MVYRIKNFSNDKGMLIVVEQLLKLSHKAVTPKRFYASPNLKNWVVNYARFCKFSHVSDPIFKT